MLFKVNGSFRYWAICVSLQKKEDMKKEGNIMEPVVMQDGKMVHDNSMEVYAKAVERGASVQFYAVEEGKEPVPLLNQPISKNDFK